MRAFVTGATGFVGSEVARMLSRAGHETACLVRGDPARLAGVDAPTIAVMGDLRDVSAFAPSLRGVDAVVHVGAVVDPRLQRDRDTMWRVNRDATVALARAARAAGVRRFVFTSSIAAMGFWSGRATAESVCTPDTGYGRAKLEAERELALLQDPSFRVVVLRPPTVYGPGEPYNFLDWVRAIERGFFFFIGNGENRFPLATTRNVARAALSAAEGALSPGVHLVADRDPYSMKRIVSAISAALGRTPPRVFVPVPVATALGVGNEAVRRLVPRLPHLLSRARVRTLTVDQRMDVLSLVSAGVPLDSPLEEWVSLTVRDYERRGLLPARTDRSLGVA
ncbi:MAG TPA: NAD-dependent epimerase/dehydratase family protein [Polyangiaceae bacterium]|nr:NAD-dependent epimerase/dehydratase family protein [Polyangiaceae bacterium]